MSFIHISALYWIVPLILFFAALTVIAAARRKKALKQLLGEEPELRNAVRLSPGKRFFRNLCLLLALLLILFAASRPYWSSRIIPYEASGRDVLVLFDVSRSMLSTDISPSRLEHAKFLLRQLAASLKGDRIGLAAFAGTAYLCCPLTTDLSAFDMYVDELTPSLVPLGGTNLERALTVASKAFQAASSPNRAIVLFTDGEELTGNCRDVIGELKRKQIPLFIVGLGDPVHAAPIPDGKGGLRRDKDGKLITSRLNETMLKQLAAATGGVYVRSTVLEPSLNVIEKRIQSLGKSGFSSGKRTLPEEKFPLFLFAAAIALFFYFVISEYPGVPWGKRKNLLVLVLLFPLALSAKDAEKPAVTDPVKLYNQAVALQTAEKAKPEDVRKAAENYEKVIALASGKGHLSRPRLCSRAYHNLGVIGHQNVIGQIAAAKKQLQSQQLQESLNTVKKALDGVAPARDLYGQSLKFRRPPKMAAQNLQLLSDNEKELKDLQKKIEELLKKQQQAQQKAKQAQNQQKEQQKQKQNQQNQQQKQQQNQQQKQQLSDSIKDAQKSAKDLKDQAGKMDQKNLQKQAEKAEKELQKAQENLQKNNSPELKKNLAEAVKALGDPENGKKQEKAAPAKKPEKPDAGKPQAAPAKPEQKPGDVDKKTAGQLLKMMNQDEKDARERMRIMRNNRIPQVEKDW